MFTSYQALYSALRIQLQAEANVYFHISCNFKQKIFMTPSIYQVLFLVSWVLSFYHTAYKQPLYPKLK